MAKPTTTTSGTSTNAFVQGGLKKSAETLSGNGALKYSTTGDDFVDQFGKMGFYKSPRTYDEIARDMSTLWANNPFLTICFVLFLRTITRIVSLFSGQKTETVQRGGGLRHESIVRMIWLHVNHTESFWKNITLFISVGSWKDVIQVLQYDLEYNGWDKKVLDWNKFGQLILAGLENPNHSELLKKYLPAIKANSNCKTLSAQADNVIAKWICSLLYGGKADGNDYRNYKKYRQLKASGTAHQWQQLISQKRLLEIDFNTIHGRALAQLVSGKFLSNNNLETKYQAWIESKPIAKFTGFVYELVQGKAQHTLKQYQKQTINAQFQQLVETAKQGLQQQGLRPISVVDCSGSMSSPMYIGNGQVGKLKSIEVAMSFALFFDEMMQTNSPFKNTYLGFGNKTEMYKTEMYQFKGSEFVDRYFGSPRNGMGGTNFESVFDFFATFKKQHPTVAESEIPNFIVCFSDGEFNGVKSKISNVEAGRQKLKAAGFSQEYCDGFGICFIDLPNTFYSRTPQTKFETYGNVKNVYYFSGYDLSPLAFLFGADNGKGQTTKIPSTAEELFLAAMDQEVLRMVEV